MGWLADLLSACLRARFVYRWNVSLPILPFTDHLSMTREVKAVRMGHNPATDHAIRAIALALRRRVHQADLDAPLANFSPGATDF